MERFLPTVMMLFLLCAWACSGVIYRASEQRANVWETGLEYQILDDQGHLDGLNPLSSAGATYPWSAHIG